MYHSLNGKLHVLVNKTGTTVKLKIYFQLWREDNYLVVATTISYDLLAAL